MRDEPLKMEITVYNNDGTVASHEVVDAGPGMTEAQHLAAIAFIDAGLPAYQAVAMAVAGHTVADLSAHFHASGGNA